MEAQEVVQEINGTLEIREPRPDREGIETWRHDLVYPVHGYSSPAKNVSKTDVSRLVQETERADPRRLAYGEQSRTHGFQATFDIG